MSKHSAKLPLGGDASFTNAVLAAILNTLALERLEHNLMRGGHGRGEHVFGGEVLAQALVAARMAIEEDIPLHSMHGYFLRLGDYSKPAVFDVDRIRDGRSFSTRRVKAIQSGKAILNLACSFHRDELGYEHQDSMPSATDPQKLPSHDEIMSAELGGEQALDEHGYGHRFQAIDVRNAGEYIAEDGKLCGRHWMRVRESLPDDRFLHAVLLAYISDMEFLDLLLSEKGEESSQYHSQLGADKHFENTQCFSLDHALWFHRDFRVDEWLLFDKEAVSAQNSRGLVRGRFFNADGVLVASVAQECLIRKIRTQDSV